LIAERHVSNDIASVRPAALQIVAERHRADLVRQVTFACELARLCNDRWPDLEDCQETTVADRSYRSTEGY